MCMPLCARNIKALATCPWFGMIPAYIRENRGKLVEKVKNVNVQKIYLSNSSVLYHWASRPYHWAPKVSTGIRWDLYSGVTRLTCLCSNSHLGRHIGLPADFVKCLSCIITGVQKNKLTATFCVLFSWVLLLVCSCASHYVYNVLHLHNSKFPWTYRVGILS